MRNVTATVNREQRRADDRFILRPISDGVVHSRPSLIAVFDPVALRDREGVGSTGGWAVCLEQGSWL